MAKRVTKSVAKKVAAKKQPPVFVDEPDYDWDDDDRWPDNGKPNWVLILALVLCAFFWYAVFRYFGIL
jgi:hypothetical protein